MALLLDFDTLPPTQGYAMWSCLMHREMRDFYVGRERVGVREPAQPRAAWAVHRDDRALPDLIAEFITRDCDVEVLMPFHDPDQQSLIYRAADEESRSASDRSRAR